MHGKNNNSRDISDRTILHANRKNPTNPPNDATYDTNQRYVQPRFSRLSQRRTSTVRPYHSSISVNNVGCNTKHSQHKSYNNKYSINNNHNHNNISYHKPPQMTHFKSNSKGERHPTKPFIRKTNNNKYNNNNRYNRSFKNTYFTNLPVSNVQFNEQYSQYQNTTSANNENNQNQMLQYSSSSSDPADTARKINDIKTAKQNNALKYTDKKAKHFSNPNTPKILQPPSILPNASYVSLPQPNTSTDTSSSSTSSSSSVSVVCSDHYMLPHCPESNTDDIKHDPQNTPDNVNHSTYHSDSNLLFSIYHKELNCQVCKSSHKTKNDRKKTEISISNYIAKRNNYIKQTKDIKFYPQNDDEMYCGIHNSSTCVHRQKTMDVMNSLCRWCSMEPFNDKHLQECWFAPHFVKNRQKINLLEKKQPITSDIPSCITQPIKSTPQPCKIFASVPHQSAKPSQMQTTNQNNISGINNAEMRLNHWKCRLNKEITIKKDEIKQDFERPQADTQSGWNNTGRNDMYTGHINISSTGSPFETSNTKESISVERANNNDQIQRGNVCTACNSTGRNGRTDVSDGYWYCTICWTNYTAMSNETFQ
eukprot:506150_1